MSDDVSTLKNAGDAGTAHHHWLFALLLGMMFGGIGVLANWIVLRALG
jgi:hypothetical protein